MTELKGIKRPNLKRVKKTADDMLGAYNDPSKLMKADFKVNLKTVERKKEDEKVNDDVVLPNIIQSITKAHLGVPVFPERRGDGLA